MRLLERTLATAEENIAFDEALLLEAESSPQPLETLRLWESTELAVVIGRSSRVREEVNLDECERLGIPILRRSSGGAAVVLGRGCLMYSVVLSYEQRPELRMISNAHQFVLDRMTRALSRLASDVEQGGTSDMVFGSKKFSGNSLRCRQRHLLYHGTILYSFELDWIERLLGIAPRQPEYRQGRSHGDFVANLPATARQIRDAVVAEWRASGTVQDWPQRLTEELVRDRYSKSEWNMIR